MGKPYASELERLDEVYAWAFQQDARCLADAVSSFAHAPLMVVGSGGSLTAAQMAVYLHQRFARRLARAATPLEVVSDRPPKETGILVVTAGGRNPDVIGAVRFLAEQEPRQLSVLCAAVGTPLARLVQKYWYARLIDFKPPSGRDGFVATNSLIATNVLLARAYGLAHGITAYLPPTLGQLFGGDAALHRFLKTLQDGSDRLRARDELLVLYGPTGFPAATDIESKFSETALGSIQLADYRNFAHGRHHGLGARRDSLGVLAIVTEDDAMLARKTLALLPKQIPIAEFRIDSSGTPAAVAALIATLHFVGWRGRNRNIDPGRPSVADFGRKLYHLNAFGRTVRHQRVTTSSIAIARKARISTEPQSQDPSIELWGKALKRTLNGFRIARFQAIVFDYDGTLCPPHSRREGIDASLAERLENLIGGGLLVGIATGRGKSVREDLQQKLRKQFWPNVWIGYYNGGQIGGLADECVPNKTAAVPESLEEMMSILKDNTRLASLVDELDSTSSQITVLPKPLREVEVWEILEELSVTHGHTAVRSTHSVDILAPGVTKLNLIAKMESLVSDGQGGEILRIGDLGRWPGNDYQLLAHRFGLSVDEVSRDSAMCWNLAPPGHRGVQATLDYLDALNIRRSHARLDVTKLGFTGQI